MTPPELPAWNNRPLEHLSFWHLIARLHIQKQPCALFHSSPPSSRLCPSSRCPRPQRPKVGLPLSLATRSTSIQPRYSYYNLNINPSSDGLSADSHKWFLGNVCKRPPAATCLFYTRGLSRAARIFSKSGGASMTTIWVRQHFIPK